MMNNFLEIIGSFIEIYLAYLCLNFLFTPKNTKAISRLILINTSILTLIVFLFNHYISLVSVMTLVITFFYIGITAHFLYKEKFFYLSSVLSFYLMFLYYNDLCCISITGSILQKPDYLDIIVSNQSSYRNMQIIINHIVLIVIFTILYHFGKVLKSQLKGNFFRYLICISIIGFLGALYLIDQTFKSLNINITISWIVFSLFIIFCMFFLYLYLKYKEDQQSIELVKLKNEALTSNYETLIHSYQINAKLYHDFNNHVDVLYELLTHQKYDDATDYLKGLVHPLKDLNSNIWTGNDIIDIIINKKLSEMKKDNISTETDIDSPLPIVINNVAICSILSNLIDNAIEACNRNKNQCNRWIKISIKKINSMIYIKITNGIEFSPHIFPNKHFTTKENKSIHGWGLENG